MPCGGSLPASCRGATDCVKRSQIRLSPPVSAEAILVSAVAIPLVTDGGSASAVGRSHVWCVAMAVAAMVIYSGGSRRVADS